MGGYWQIGEGSVKKSTQQFQQNFNQIRKRNEVCEYKAGSPAGREYWGQEWVTRAVNNVRLQQKANSCPCADRSRSNYWAIHPQRPSLEDHKPRKPAAEEGDERNGWLQHITCWRWHWKEDPHLLSRICNQEPAKQLNWETYLKSKKYIPTVTVYFGNIHYVKSRNWLQGNTLAFSNQL